MYKIIPLRNNPFGKNQTPVSIVIKPRDNDDEIYGRSEFTDIINIDHSTFEDTHTIFHYSYTKEFDELSRIEKIALFMVNAIPDLLVFDDDRDDPDSWANDSYTDPLYDFGFDGDHRSYEFTEDEIDIFAAIVNERMFRYDEWCDNYHELISKLSNITQQKHIKKILSKCEDMMQMFLLYGMPFYIKDTIEKFRINSFSLNDIDLSIDAKDNSTWIFDSVVNNDVF